MKKFSNITGQKVGQEPKIEVKKLNEEELFKAKIMNLMDQLLSVRTYGPVDRYIRAGNIKVAGKELFLEALLDLFSDKTLKQQAKLLEGLKSDINNWEVIDSKIDEVNTKIVESSEKSKLNIHRNKLEYLYNTYNDEEIIIKMVESSCNKIKNPEIAHLRSITSGYMANEGKYPKEIFEKISQMYSSRSKELRNK
jgi:hypothetical protein